MTGNKTIHIITDEIGGTYGAFIDKQEAEKTIISIYANGYFGKLDIKEDILLE